MITKPQDSAIDDDEILNGLRFPVLLDAGLVAGKGGALASLDDSTLTIFWAKQRLQTVERLWRQQQFHVRLVALFDTFPDIDAIEMHFGRVPGKMTPARMSDFLEVRLAAGSKSKSRVQAAVADIKRIAGGASDEVLSDIGATLVQAHGWNASCTIERKDCGKWLEKALDPRLLRVAKAALQAERLAGKASAMDGAAVSDGAAGRTRRPRA